MPCGPQIPVAGMLAIIPGQLAWVMWLKDSSHQTTRSLSLQVCPPLLPMLTQVRLHHGLFPKTVKLLSPLGSELAFQGCMYGLCTGLMQSSRRQDSLEL